MVLLGRYKSIEGYVTTSINDLVIKAGYKPDSHKGRINSKIRESLQNLSNKMMIECNFYDFSDVKSNQLIDVLITEDALFETQGYFTKLTFDDLDVILNNDTSINKSFLLHGFLAIKQYISGNPNVVGAQTLAYPSIPTIREIMGVSSNDTVENVLDTLCNIGLLYMKNCGSYYKNGKPRNCPNCYALEEKYLQDAEKIMKLELRVNDFKPLILPKKIQA